MLTQVGERNSDDIEGDRFVAPLPHRPPQIERLKKVSQGSFTLPQAVINHTDVIEERRLPGSIANLPTERERPQQMIQSFATLTQRDVSRPQGVERSGKVASIIGGLLNLGRLATEFERLLFLAQITGNRAELAESDCFPAAILRGPGKREQLFGEGARRLKLAGNIASFGRATQSQKIGLAILSPVPEGAGLTVLLGRLPERFGSLLPAQVLGFAEAADSRG